ncbi:MAG: hypothetical protein OEU94_12005, partial [Aquincola sp.]|nr:hypothetical protein [Aquincola sp.]
MRALVLVNLSLEPAMSKNMPIRPLVRTLFIGAMLSAVTAAPAWAAISCARNLTAEVVAIDQPLMFNRMGAANVNGMMFALKRDVVDAAGVPLTVSG